MAHSTPIGNWRKIFVQLSTAAVAAVALGLLIAQTRYASGRPPAATVLVFAALVVWASNFWVGLTSDMGVNPALMVVMVAVVAFHDRGGVLAAALIGLSGGLLRDTLMNSERSWRGNLLMTAFNCGQFLLSAVAAALVYTSIYTSGLGGSVGRTLAAAGCAALVFTILNPGLCSVLIMSSGVPGSAVWDELRPALPGLFTFGLIGALVGELYAKLGLLSLVLLVVPVLIARRTYRATLELREAQDQAIGVFLQAMRAKDLYTAQHTERVAKYAVYIGEEFGWHGARLTHLRQAALMHDIGKLAVSSELLNKPGRLTPEEYAEIRRHNEVCVSILSQVAFLQSTIPVASDRHGFFDASEGMKGDPAVMEAYIVAVVDAFDAMTSTRAYRKALSMEVAFEELVKGKGTQFDPDCVDALIAAIARRDEHFGAGYESATCDFAVEPPAAGVGSAGLGDLELPALPHRSPRSGTRLPMFGR